MREKGSALPLILIAIIGVLIVGGLIFYIFRQNSQLEAVKKAQAALNEEKVQLEKDLIFYKNTDLAKEVEILKLKLDTKEKELADSKGQVSNLQAKVVRLETNAPKIKTRVEIIAAIEKMFIGSGPTAAGVSSVDTKVASLGDSALSDAWEKAKSQINLNARSWEPQPINDVVDLITSQVRDFL